MDPGTNFPSFFRKVMFQAFRKRTLHVVKDFQNMVKRRVKRQMAISIVNGDPVLTISWILHREFEANQMKSD